MSLSVNDVK